MRTASISATLEDYLESILNIVRKHKVARSMEIAESLNVKRPTVTVALRALADKGYINYEPRSFVTLTQSGEKVAECVDNRHHILREVFTELFRLPAKESEMAACLMEHGMNTNVCKAMTGLLRAVRNDETLARHLFAALDKESRSINCASVCDHTPAQSGPETKQRQYSNLNMLGSGKSAKIMKIVGNGSLKKRLGEMGVTSGQQITVVKAAPLDDPIQVKVRNYSLSLRREEARNILIDTE